MKQFYMERTGAVMEYVAVMSLLGFVILFISLFFRDTMNTWIDQTAETSVSGVGQSYYVGGSNQTVITPGGNNGDLGLENILNNKNYQRTIKISPSTQDTDIQIKVTLTQGSFDYSKLKDDGSDIRFTDKNGESIPHWIEKFNPNGETVIWVKVSEKYTSEIIMLYGEKSTSYKQRPEEVFVLFDDFDDGSIYENKWYESNDFRNDMIDGKLIVKQGSISTFNPVADNLEDGYSIHARVLFKGSGTGAGMSGAIPALGDKQFVCEENSCASAAVVVAREANYSKNVSLMVGDGTINTFNKGHLKDGFTSTDNLWYDTELSVLNGTVKFKVNDQVKYTVSNISWHKKLKYVTIGAYTQEGNDDIQDTHYDYIYVTKMNTNNTTATLGPELQR